MFLTCSCHALAMPASGTGLVHLRGALDDETCVITNLDSEYEWSEWRAGLDDRPSPEGQPGLLPWAEQYESTYGFQFHSSTRLMRSWTSH